MFLIIPGVIGLTLILWGLYLFFKKPSSIYGRYDQDEVSIGEHKFGVEVVSNIVSRTQGLSGRKSMAMNEGMLFIFPIAARYSFWMKGMLFPIDIVWIRDGKIVDISKDVSAPINNGSVFDIPVAKPVVAVDRVLEVNAGISAKYGWKIGDIVYFGHI